MGLIKTVHKLKGVGNDIQGDARKTLSRKNVYEKIHKRNRAGEPNNFFCGSDPGSLAVSPIYFLIL